jgi:diguanylate cyclase (GGDEF)-like protein
MAMVTQLGSSSIEPGIVAVVEPDARLRGHIVDTLRPVGLDVVGSASLAEVPRRQRVAAVVVGPHVSVGSPAVGAPFGDAVVVRLARSTRSGHSDLPAARELVGRLTSTEHGDDERHLARAVSRRWVHGPRSMVANALVHAIASDVCLALPSSSDDLLEQLSLAFERALPSVEELVPALNGLRSAFEAALDEGADAGVEVLRLHRLTRVLELVSSTAIDRSVERLHADALTDSLTGLGNRRALDADLARVSAGAIRHGHPLTVALVDLDGLKLVNDHFGHAAGDAALRAMADALNASLRGADRAYRSGGDEFVLLLPDTVVTGPEFLQARMAAAGAPACSVGVATFPADPIEQLVELADARMYASRQHRGRRTDECCPD